MSSITSKARGAGLHRRVLEGGTVDGDSDLNGEGGGDGVKRTPCTTRPSKWCSRTARPAFPYVQRKLRIGYNRSARLLEDTEKAGW